MGESPVRALEIKISEEQSDTAEQIGRVSLIYSHQIVNGGYYCGCEL